VILTAFANVEAALTAIREGAYDYVSKPLRLDELILTIRRALDQLHLTRENRQFRETLTDRYTLANIIGVSPAMIEVFKLVARVAPTGRPHHRRAGRAKIVARALPSSALGRPVRHDSLCGPGRDPAGERTLRARPGCLHGCGGRAARSLRGRPGGNRVSR
jgi:hypothetical protein